MIHDIKAPLKSIKGYSYLIEKELIKDNINSDNIIKHFSYIRKSIRLLEGFLDDYLVQSKATLAQLKIERINVKKLIEIQLFKLRYQIEKSDAQINLSNLGYIHGHKRSFESLFSNLISNALKFQPQNKIHKPIIRITQTRKNKEILIQIEDNGIGIKEEHLTDIFEPFNRLNYSLAYKGTGLGLSICKTIVEKHEGRIEVESELNKGTIFKIFIQEAAK